MRRPLDLAGESPVCKGGATSCSSEHWAAFGDECRHAYGANFVGRKGMSLER
jgi:hypothetical protein